jgi:hypothetical protein
MILFFISKPFLFDFDADLSGSIGRIRENGRRVSRFVASGQGNRNGKVHDFWVSRLWDAEDTGSIDIFLRRVNCICLIYCCIVSPLDKYVKSVYKNMSVRCSCALCLHLHPF